LSREAARTSDELEELGLDNQQLVINAIFEAHARSDAVAVALEQRGRAALAQMPDALRSLADVRDGRPTAGRVRLRRDDGANDRGLA
jgi:hypothetical protein